MVSLCGDFILRPVLSRHRLILCCLLLYIYMRDIGVFIALFFFLSVSECGWNNEVCVRVLSFFLCVICSASILILFRGIIDF